MRPRSIRLEVLPGLVVLGIALGTAADVAAGPISRLYVTRFGSIDVIQGDSTVDTWATIDTDERSLAVRDTVRVLPQGAGGDGHEYTLDGTATGAAYPVVGCCFRDATADGFYNYALADEVGVTTLYQFDADWSNPQAMSITGLTDETGLAYDARDDSFWLSGSSGSASSRVLVIHISRAGELLGAFSTARSGLLTALALDPADHTLWLWTSDEFGGTDDPRFVQYSSAGGFESLRTPLSSFAWSIADSAEFGPGAAPIPEPSMLILLGVGISAQRVWRRINGMRTK